MNDLISLLFYSAPCVNFADAAPAGLQVESARPCGLPDASPDGLDDDLDFAALLDRNWSSAAQFKTVDNGSSPFVPSSEGAPVSSVDPQPPASVATPSLSEEGGPNETLLPVFEPSGPEAGNLRRILVHPNAGIDLVRWISSFIRASIAPAQSETAISSVPVLKPEIDDAALEDQAEEPATVMNLLTPPAPAQPIVKTIVKPIEAPVVKADAVAVIEPPTAPAGIAPASDAPARITLSNLEPTVEARARIETPKHAEAISPESISSSPQPAKPSARVDREPLVSLNSVPKSAAKIDAPSTVLPEAYIHHETASTAMRSGESPPPSFVTPEKEAPVASLKMAAEEQDALEVWKPAFSQSSASDLEMTEALTMKPLPMESGRRVLVEIDQTVMAARMTQPLAAAAAGPEIRAPRTAASFRAVLAAPAPAGHDELNGEGSIETMEPLAPPSVLRQTDAPAPRDTALPEHNVASETIGQKATGAKVPGFSPTPFAPLEAHDQTVALQPVPNEARPESFVTSIKDELKRPVESDIHDAVNVPEMAAPIANGMQIAKPWTSHDKANREVIQQTAEPIIAASEQLRPNEPKTLRLKLRPEEMGEVEVEIRCDAAGRISAHLSVEHERTGSVLNHGIAELRDALERAGLDVGRLEVSPQSRDAGFVNTGQSGSGQSSSAWTAGSDSGQSGTPRNIDNPAPNELELESTRNGGSQTAQDRLLNLHA